MTCLPLRGTNSTRLLITSFYSDQELAVVLLNKKKNKKKGTDSYVMVEQLLLSIKYCTFINRSV